MVPVIHIFYSPETQLRGFSAVILYPMAATMTDCVRSHYDAIDLTIDKARRELMTRNIDRRAPILAHKVTQKRVEEIERAING